MSLSIIVPTYKRPVFLNRNLNSLIESNLQMLEVIIGDDYGDIATIDLCEEFSKKIPLKRLPPANHSSLASNISRLITESKGDWILLLHDDDFLVGDHSSFPASFNNKCDLYFTDHWISMENGYIDKDLSVENTIRYGRDKLNEGNQYDLLDIFINQSICLDGFYVKRKFINNLPLNPLHGQVADYFWMYYVLTSGVKVCYSSNRTFAYRLSNDGLTSTGGKLNEYNVLGFVSLMNSTDDYVLKKAFIRKISFNTWYSVNSCIRRKDLKQAWTFLKNINFNYTHSFAHKNLIFFQIVWIITIKIKMILTSLYLLVSEKLVKK